MTIVTEQRMRRDEVWTVLGAPLGREPDLALVFGGAPAIARRDWFDELRRLYPNAPIVGCSTAGEILGPQVFDDTISVTSLAFEHTGVSVAVVPITRAADSRAAGEALARGLPADGLAHVLVFSDGLCVNGTALVEGLLSLLPSGTSVTGGLAGDGERMQTTYVCASAPGASNLAVAVGLYGQRLRVGYGSLGGWDPFGPERVITRSSGNILYELDQQSALALYKRYLGEHAGGLPSAALLFPLSVRSPTGGARIVRTILGVDEVTQCLVFAGDLPEGHYAQLMKANFDRLVDGAFGAARLCVDRGGTAEVALLVSCVGRRLVLKQRIEEELESVREVLGPVPLAGFYSYGELCPTGAVGCDLHNQTMTITTFAET
jgi:hypothetical protein